MVLPDQWPKIEVVHCGVDNSFLETPFQVPPSPRYVCVARFVAVKAHLILVGAVRHLQSWVLIAKLCLSETDR